MKWKTHSIICLLTQFSIWKHKKNRNDNLNAIKKFWMRKKLKMSYKNICQSFYRIHQRINNESTITRQRSYKLLKKRRKNLHRELNLTNEQNLVDFKNALT